MQSLSRPALIAKAPASAADFAYLWPVSTSRTASQSPVTNPWNFHCSRSVPSSRDSLAHPGTPLMALYTHITDFTLPSTTAARKAGR